MNNMKKMKEIREMSLFPSPTGVNYYEYDNIDLEDEESQGFRPQQGLTIMNKKKWLKEDF